jgi:bis(5'-nucleosidyl)-tetraphosphatase
MHQERSAGSILFYNEDEILYLLLHYEAGHWDFPKGHIEPGELDKDTVKREIREETSIEKIEFIDGFKEKIHYFYRIKGNLMSKDVSFYLVKANDRKVKISYEHIGFMWLPYGKAFSKLTFKNAKMILKKADDFLKKHKTLD